MKPDSRLARIAQAVASFEVCHFLIPFFDRSIRDAKSLERVAPVERQVPDKKAERVSIRMLCFCYQHRVLHFWRLPWPCTTQPDIIRLKPLDKGESKVSQLCDSPVFT